MRYLFLNTLQEKSHVNHDTKASIKLLCLTDIDIVNTAYQFQFVAQFIAEYGGNLSIDLTIKPHPFMPNLKQLLAKYFRNNSYTVTYDHFSEFRQAVDCALVCNPTTAAVEMAYMKIPFCILKNPNTFNFSPLMKHKAFFIEGVQGLYKAICEPNNAITMIDDFLTKDKNFFYLDDALLRWKKILAEA